MAVFSEIPSDALFYRRSDRNHVLFVDTPRVDGHHRIFPLHYDSDILESISCGKATVDVPFKAYFTIISPNDGSRAIFQSQERRLPIRNSEVVYVGGTRLDGTSE